MGDINKKLRKVLLEGMKNFQVSTDFQSFGKSFIEFTNNLMDVICELADSVEGLREEFTNTNLQLVNEINDRIEKINKLYEEFSKKTSSFSDDAITEAVAEEVKSRLEKYTAELDAKFQAITAAMEELMNVILNYFKQKPAVVENVTDLLPISEDESEEDEEEEEEEFEDEEEDEESEEEEEEEEDEEEEEEDEDEEEDEEEDDEDKKKEEEVKDKEENEGGNEKNVGGGGGGSQTGEMPANNQTPGGIGGFGGDQSTTPPTKIPPMSDLIKKVRDQFKEDKKE